MACREIAELILYHRDEFGHLTWYWIAGLLIRDKSTKQLMKLQELLADSADWALSRWMWCDSEVAGTMSHAYTSLGASKMLNASEDFCFARPADSQYILDFKIMSLTQAVKPICVGRKSVVCVESVLRAQSAFVKFLYCWKHQPYWWICWIFCRLILRLCSLICQISSVLGSFRPLKHADDYVWTSSLAYGEIVFCTGQISILLEATNILMTIHVRYSVVYVELMLHILSGFCIVGNFWAIVSSLIQQLNVLMETLGVFPVAYVENMSCRYVRSLYWRSLDTRITHANECVGGSLLLLMFGLCSTLVSLLYNLLKVLDHETTRNTETCCRKSYFETPSCT